MIGIGVKIDFDGFNEAGTIPLFSDLVLAWETLSKVIVSEKIFGPGKFVPASLNVRLVLIYNGFYILLDENDENDENTDGWNLFQVFQVLLDCSGNASVTRSWS